MDLPELGVGIIYTPELEPIIESSPSLIDVVELEPQTTWRYSPGGEVPFKPDAGLLARLQALPQAKLVHGVGFPVGGSHGPDRHQLELYVQTALQLDAPWASEHLAFNRARGEDGSFNTGFLLPPLLNAAGVDVAVESIRAVADHLPVPFAVETGVNYLGWAGGLTDGAFVAAVTTAADCGILLDLHNLWANERNGRQSIAGFMDEIPLDRVWEIHIAGGMERGGYWLDAHSGAIPERLLGTTARLVPSLPNLRAIVFEILASHIPEFGIDGVRAELEKLRRIWDSRGRKRRKSGNGRVTRARSASDVDDVTPAAWEDTLGALVIGRSPPGKLGVALAADPGVAVLRELVWEFRAGAIVDTLRLTTRLLLLELGEKGLRTLLGEFFSSQPPELFASAEAEAFAGYLHARDLDLPYLHEVLGFERAAIRALVEGKSQIVEFHHEPMALLEAVGKGVLPDDPVRGTYEVEVTPEADAAAAAHGRILTTT